MRPFLFFVIIRLMLLMNTSDRFMHIIHWYLKYIDLFLGNKSAKQGLLSNSTFNWLFISNSQLYNLSSGEKMCQPEMHSKTYFALGPWHEIHTLFGMEFPCTINSRWRGSCKYFVIPDYIIYFFCYCKYGLLLSQCTCDDTMQVKHFNSLALGNFEGNFRHIIFKMTLFDGLRIFCEIVLIWMHLASLMISQHWFR